MLRMESGGLVKLTCSLQGKRKYKNEHHYLVKWFLEQFEVSR